MKDITLIPFAGLCNRMRAVSSGIFAAKEMDVPLFIYWNKTHDCFANWSDLFLPLQLTGVSIIENRNPINWISNKRTFRIPAFIRQLLYEKCIRGFSRNNGKTILEEDRFLNTEGHVCIESCCDLCDHFPLNKIFILTEELENKVNEIKSSFSQKTIGVHIRRTDNYNSIKSNTINDFVKRMVEELNSDCNISFYLATDDYSVKTIMRNKFGDRILSPQFELSRTSVNGMKDAVVDLYCLSKTNHIIGSFYSSYSEIASELGNIELEIINDDSKVL